MNQMKRIVERSLSRERERNSLDLILLIEYSKLINYSPTARGLPASGSCYRTPVTEAAAGQKISAPIKVTAINWLADWLVEWVARRISILISHRLIGTDAIFRAPSAGANASAANRTACTGLN